MAERRKLPVEDRKDLRLARMEDQVVHPVVAVHHHRLVAPRNVLRQPGDQPVHRLDSLRLRGLVLPAPAPDLAREIISRLSEIGKTRGPVIDPVQGGQYAIHLVVDRFALGRRHPGKRRVPQHAPLDVFHDVERAADDVFVLAQAIGPGHGNARLRQRGDHTELALDRVRRGQQLRRRAGLGAQHPALAAAGENVGRVGLPAPELPDLERPGKSFDAGPQIALERPDVETMALLYRHGADELSAHRDGPLCLGICASLHAGKVGS